MDPSGLRIGIAGVGATGGYLAAALAAVGTPVTVLARGASARAIRADGLCDIGPDGSETRARPAAVAEPGDEVDEVDLVLFCVKSYDTPAAAPAIAGLMGERGVVLCLQNGVVNEEILERHYGPDRVMSGVMYIGAERTGPGTIVRTTAGRVILGPYQGDATLPLCRASVDALTVAGVDAQLDADIRTAKWQKFLFNCGLNPLTTLTGQRLGAIRSTDAGRRLFDELVTEALAAAQAVGAPLPEDAHARVMATADRMDISSSMAEDLHAGRPMELDAFTGHVLSLGRTNATPAPTTRLVHDLLEVLDARRRSPSGDAGHR